MKVSLIRGSAIKNNGVTFNNDSLCPLRDVMPGRPNTDPKVSFVRASCVFEEREMIVKGMVSNHVKQRKLPIGSSIYALEEPKKRETPRRGHASRRSPGLIPSVPLPMLPCR